MDGEISRRQRRKKKRADEESIESVSTISKIVEDELKPKLEVAKETEDIINEESFEAKIVEVTKKRKKKSRSRGEEGEEAKDDDEAASMTEQRKTKSRRRKKKQAEGYQSSDSEGNERKQKSKRRTRKRITDSQTLLRDDFYSDPQLATTLQGLEDDMFSINGDGDTPALSPYPILPSLPASQPVAKIYLEKQGGFSKASVATKPATPSSTGSESQFPSERTPVGRFTKKLVSK